jgi:hypothetical protein
MSRWSGKKEDTSDEVEKAQEPAPKPSPARSAPLFIHRRPREGYVDFGDRLDTQSVRVGTNTFALKREPGQRHGAFREPQED